MEPSRTNKCISPPRMNVCKESPRMKERMEPPRMNEYKESSRLNKCMEPPRMNEWVYPFRIKLSGAAGILFYAVDRQMASLSDPLEAVYSTSCYCGFLSETWNVGQNFLLHTHFAKNRYLSKANSRPQTSRRGLLDNSVTTSQKSHAS